MFDRKNFAKQLQNYMDRNGLNQVEMAKKIGVSSAAISSWLSEKREPRLIYQNLVLQTISSDLGLATKGAPYRIIRQGTKKEETFVMRRFSCSSCGCVFEVSSEKVTVFTEKDIAHLNESSIDLRSGILTALSFSVCPECEAVVVGCF